MSWPAREARTAGSVSVEALILVPFFLMVVFTILEASLWVYSSSVAQAAAEDGARAGTVSGGNEQEGKDIALDILAARSVGEGWEVVTTASSEGLTVAVSGRAPSVVPGMSLTVTESATLPWEDR